MIISIAAYNTRIATLLDTALQYQLYSYDSSSFARKDTLFGPMQISTFASACRVHSVSALVCGGICRCDYIMLSRMNISVISGVCGDIPAVLEALHKGTIESMFMAGRTEFPCCNLRKKQCF